MIRKNLAALCLAALTASICVAAPPALAAHKVTIEVYDQSNWQSWTCYGPTRKITDFTCPDQMFDEVVITAEGSRKVLARGELYWATDPEFGIVRRNQQYDPTDPLQGPSMKYYILGTLQATVTLPYAAKYSLYFTYGSSHAGPHKVFFSYLKDMHWTAKIPAFRLTG